MGILQGEGGPWPPLATTNLRHCGSPQASAAVSIGRAEGRCGDEAGAGGVEAVAEEA